jgi:TPR repeat protein
MLENGLGVAQNYTEAARHYKLAADQGNPVGQRLYARMLVNGRGVAKDYAEALRYATLSMNQGDTHAKIVYFSALVKMIGSAILDWSSS